MNLLIKIIFKRISGKCAHVNVFRYLQCGLKEQLRHVVSKKISTFPGPGFPTLQSGVDILVSQ